MNALWQHPFMLTVRAIVWKDLRIERHTGQTISIMTFFSLAAVVTFNLALAGDLAAVRSVGSGLLWVTILLAGTLGLNRSFSSEQENRSLDALLMSPSQPTAIYVGKVISVTTMTMAQEIILLFIFAVVTNQPFLQLGIIGILFLGTIGYIAAGVLVTSMTIQTRAREVLLPVLLLPLSLPVVLAAASVTARLVSGTVEEWADIGFAVSLVVLYDILMLIAGTGAYRYVVEE